MQQIIVMAHCLLNPTVRLRGQKSPDRPELTGNIIQLPCPEAAYMGLKRWEVTREQLDIPSYRRFCKEIFLTTADILQMLHQEGYAITLIGIPGSPSCGAKTSSIGMDGGLLYKAGHIRVEGAGIFFQEIVSELKRRGVEFTIDE